MLVCYKPELTSAWPRAMAEVASPKRLAELTGLGYSTCCRIMRANPETLELRSETAAKLRRLVETYIESPAPAPGNVQEIPQIAKESILIELIDKELSTLPAERLENVYRAIVSKVL